MVEELQERRARSRRAMRHREEEVQRMLEKPRAKSASPSMTSCETQTEEIYEEALQSKGYLSFLCDLHDMYTDLTVRPPPTTAATANGENGDAAPVEEVNNSWLMRSLTIITTIFMLVIITYFYIVVFDLDDYTEIIQTTYTNLRSPKQITFTEIITNIIHSIY